ncbi:hypothetical protein P8452_61598 [Trifolium repens]|nr:hypothetical protein P8452_61598 [Trifolium repens]
MAISFVSDITASLIAKLASFAYEEVSQAYGVNNRGGGVTRRLSILKMMKLCKRQMQLEGPQEKAKQWLMGLEKMNAT